MRIRILTPEQSPDWYRILHRLPAHDAYFLPEYHLAYERNGDGAATAFAAEEGGEILFHPFLVRPITRVGKTATTEGWSDIETVYGYSGPLATTTDPEFLRSSWSAFSDWCSEQRIVAEFIRFHPIADTTRFADASIRITRQRETVVLDLQSTEEALWQSYPSRQRNMVRKARKRGLVGRRANLVADLETFHKLYRSTVERLQADRYYRFSRAYFSTLTHDEKNHVHLFEVRDDARVAAAALFLVCGNQMSYHLAGSDDHYRRDAPNNLLLHTAALWGQEQGCRRLFLGGGTSNASDDPLLRFKASISRRRLPFHVGTRVHDRVAYDNLCNHWIEQHSLSEKPSYFLLYRLEETP